MSFIGDKLNEMMTNSTYKRLPIYRDIVELMHEGYGNSHLNIIMPDGNVYNKTYGAIMTYPNTFYIELDEDAEPSRWLRLRDLYDTDESVWYDDIYIESPDYPLHGISAIWAENGEIYISANP